MQAKGKGKLDVGIVKVSSPVLAGRVWEIESFCLKIFEYGDYSFRRALAGTLGRGLGCVFFIAQHNGSIVGAAGCLYCLDNPAVALVGPVCVEAGYRGQEKNQTSVFKAAVAKPDADSCR